MEGDDNHCDLLNPSHQGKWCAKPANPHSG